MTEQEARKKQSEDILIEMGVDYLEHLPLIESEEDTKIRKTLEVGHRILCLLAVAAASDGIDSKEILQWLKREDIYSSLSDEEREYLEKSKKTEEENFQFSWRSECIWILLWATKKVERNTPTEQCDIQNMLEFLPEFNGSTIEFLESIDLRSKKEILDLSDFIYRAHWATRHSGFDEDVRIGSLNPDVVMEWHKAINWLTNYGESDDWDEVTTDT